MKKLADRIREALEDIPKVEEKKDVSGSEFPGQRENVCQR